MTKLVHDLDDMFDFVIRRFHAAKTCKAKRFWFAKAALIGDLIVTLHRQGV